MASNKTSQTAASVEGFVETISERRQREATRLIETMRDITGQEPAMWGPSIIGFGRLEYTNSTGTQQMFELGFSPRKGALTFYMNDGFHELGPLLETLGKHKTSVACLYVNKLEDIDYQVLRSVLEATYQRVADPNDPEDEPTTVDGYLAKVPAVANEKFAELRDLVMAALPDSEETLSYGRVCYESGRPQARVFIGAWSDHVGIYPAPKEPNLRRLLKPYLKGSDLWFSLDDPLPGELIAETVAAMARQ